MSPSLVKTVQQRLKAILGQSVTMQKKVIGGYTPADRWIIQSEKTTYFAKIATTPLTAKLLRREAHAYQVIRGSFMPEWIGWEDDETQPILVTEDLSDAHWPPPWDRSMVDAVLEQLEMLHQTKADVPTFAEAHGHWEASDWLAVAEAPEPFLSLGLVDKAWLAKHLPLLIEMESRCEISGTAVTHCDIRSDNLCITTSGVKIVDWPEACLSNPKLDIGFWSPSLAYEAGILPETILPDSPEIAAVVAGFFAARAGQPPIPDAPFVRRVQRQQLETALPWAMRVLDIQEKQ